VTPAATPHLRGVLHPTYYPDDGMWLLETKSAERQRLIAADGHTTFIQLREIAKAVGMRLGTHPDAPRAAVTRDGEDRWMVVCAETGRTLKTMDSATRKEAARWAEERNYFIIASCWEPATNGGYRS